MSSENCVRIAMAENLRILGEGSSALGKSEAKARPKGVVDAQTVDIPLPLTDLSTLTQCGIVTRALVDPGVRDRIYREVRGSSGEKRYVYISGARTANRHR